LFEYIIVNISEQNTKTQIYLDRKAVLPSVTRRIRQSLRILMPTKPAAWSIQPVIEAQVTAESTVNRQHPSIDCPAGAINRKSGKGSICRRAYKHEYYLKLSASAYPDPGAQLIFPACTCTSAFLTDKSGGRLGG
jgi:hypothetical protein